MVSHVYLNWLYGLASVPAVDDDGSQLTGGLSSGGGNDYVQDGHSVEHDSIPVPVDHLELGHSVRLT